jgi:hypothetical protein
MTCWLRRAPSRLRSTWLSVAAFVGLVMTASPALAVFPGNGGGGSGGGGSGSGGGTSGSGGSAPEINPAAAAGALTLLCGAFLIVYDSRRRRQLLATEPA